MQDSSLDYIRYWKKFNGNRFEYYLNIVNICGKQTSPISRYIIAMAYSWNSTIYCKEAIKYLNLYLSKPLYKGAYQNYCFKSDKIKCNYHIADMYCYLGKAYKH